MIFLTTGALRRLSGVLLIVLPHVFEAPRSGGFDSAVPAALAAEFAVASLAANLVFWAVLGALAAAALGRRNRDAGG